MAYQAGTWIAKIEKLNNTKILLNDQLISFYIDAASGNRYNTEVYIVKDPQMLFRYAIKNDSDAIIFKTQKNAIIDNFSGYNLIHEFTNNNKTVRIYLKEHL